MTRSPHINSTRGAAFPHPRPAPWPATVLARLERSRARTVTPAPCSMSTAAPSPPPSRLPIASTAIPGGRSLRSRRRGLGPGFPRLRILRTATPRWTNRRRRMPLCAAPPTPPTDRGRRALSSLEHSGRPRLSLNRPFLGLAADRPLRRRPFRTSSTVSSCSADRPPHTGWRPTPPRPRLADRTLADQWARFIEDVRPKSRPSLARAPFSTTGASAISTAIPAAARAILRREGPDRSDSTTSATPGTAEFPYRSRPGARPRRHHPRRNVTGSFPTRRALAVRWPSRLRRSARHQNRRATI